LAPLLTEEISKQTQFDRSQRSVLNWNGNIGKIATVLRTSALMDVLDYRDEAKPIHSYSSSLVSRSEAMLSYAIEKSKTTITPAIAAKYDYEQSISDTSGTGLRHRNIIETRQAISFSAFNKQFSLTATLFQTFANRQVIPAFNLFASYNRKIGKTMQYFNFSVARTLRIPSMNDLYYAVYGNPNLKPETGWKSELKWKMQHRFFETGLTFYGQYAENWILWTPQTTTIGYWMPQNLKRVYGCGIDFHITAGWLEEPQKRKWFAYIMSSYGWNRMINMTAVSASDASANKQLIYVPIHKIYAALKTGWRGFMFALDYTFFSRIYTTTDNSSALNAYGLIDMHLAKTFDIRGQKITLGFCIYNVFNTVYQTMPQRAMPARYYEAMLRFNLKG
jgi:outer membrane cobalamin receptor